MPILPVPGGGGATLPTTYYNSATPNLGDYGFIAIKEIINNFQAAYIGEGKILENVLRGDVTFHAFRALQELHYDTIQSCKSQEIEVCPSLTMPLPHDYVNYVKLVFTDNNGIERIIYPARNTSNPYPIEQDGDCAYTDDILDDIENNVLPPDSDTWDKYKQSGDGTSINSTAITSAAKDNGITYNNTGKRYGIDPQYAQGNGSYFIDCERGNIHFSSNLAGLTVILKYISDGVGTEEEAIVHKFAEEAMYKWIAHGCAAARKDSPEYLIARLKKERFAETRKAKIRLSNIKIEEISQVFRGKSKWIQH